jgi:hypothetical protein
LAQAPQDFEAIDTRQHHVQHHQSDSRLESGGETTVPFVLALYGKALSGEEFFEQRTELGIVIHQHDVHG